MLIKEVGCIGDNSISANRIISTSTFLSTVLLGYNVSAVQGIVKTTPARISGIESKAGIINGHNQLGTRH